MDTCILYDCDTGCDDAIALMMLLSYQKKIKTVAITCVGGNADMDNVVMNNLRILKLFNCLDDIPLYKGCKEPIVPIHTPGDAKFVHGKDGMCDCPNVFSPASPDLLGHVKSEHAVNAIISLSKEYSGKLKIIATGPLTNLAMAVKLDPELPSRLSGLYIMGGTRAVTGNITPTAEFNFYFDPEAVWITMKYFPIGCSVHLIDYELTIEHLCKWDWVNGWLSKAEDERHVFAKALLQPFCNCTKSYITDKMGLVLYDAYAMAVVIDNNVGITPTKYNAVVELGGFHCRGTFALDHQKISKDALGPIFIFKSIDVDRYCTMLDHALCG